MGCIHFGRGDDSHSMEKKKSSFSDPGNLVLLKQLDPQTYAQYYIDNGSLLPSFPTVPTLFEFKDILGQGETSTVFEAIFRPTGQKVAVKFIPNFYPVRGTVLRELLTLKISNQCRHLIGYHSHFRVDNECYIITEAGSKYNFHTVLSPNYTLPPKVIQVYFKQLCQAIMFLHERCIVHRDVTLKNLILDVKGNLRLTDYGLCRTVNDPNGLRFTDWGTLLYAAPEIYKDKLCSYPVDWWSAGVVLYRFVTGGFPFPTTKRRSYSYYVVLHHVVVYPKKLFESAELKDLNTSLLEKKPKCRIGTSDEKDIKNHAYFSDIDWDEIDHVESAILQCSPEELKSHKESYRNIISILDSAFNRSNGFEDNTRWKLIEDDVCDITYPSSDYKVVGRQHCRRVTNPITSLREKREHQVLDKL